MSKITSAALAAGLLSFALPLAASAASHLTLVQTFQPVDANLTAGDTTTIHNTNSQLQNGEHVRFTIVAKNDGDRPARDVEAIEAIPKGQHLIATSVSGSTAQVSTDHGATWHRVPNSGTLVNVNAIRWTPNRMLAAGGEMTFHYETVVNTSGLPQ
jgi:uncharacterized repeat protein (TIGR01451 family)